MEFLLKIFGKFGGYILPISSWRKKYRKMLKELKEQDAEKQKKAKRQAIEQWKKQAKFGVSYSVWDGEELLESSIRQIRDEVDHINVVWPEKSWRGEASNPNLFALLQQLHAQGLIDELIEYESLCNNTYQENIKRQLGLEAAKKAGCHYFMTLDTDEFFVTHDFKRAKEFMLDEEITNGFILIKMYGSQPTLQWTRNEMLPSIIPFFSRLMKESHMDIKAEYPYITDISRKISVSPDAKFCLLPYIAMHHMSFIRKDLHKKFEGSSSEELYKRIKIYDRIPKVDSESVVVEDQFNLLEVMSCWE